jgi:hypothetical protein
MGGGAGPVSLLAELLPDGGPVRLFPMPPAALPPNGPASGDLGGTYPAPSVVALQGRSVQNAAPGVGSALVWNNAASQWQPAQLFDANVAAGAGIARSKFAVPADQVAALGADVTLTTLATWQDLLSITYTPPAAGLLHYVVAICRLSNATAGGISQATVAVYDGTGVAAGAITTALVLERGTSIIGRMAASGAAGDSGWCTIVAPWFPPLSARTIRLAFFSATAKVTATASTTNGGVVLPSTAMSIVGPH